MGEGAGYAKVQIDAPDAQRFLAASVAVYNLFNLGRHLVAAENYGYSHLRAFASWEKTAANEKRLNTIAVDLRN